MGVLKDNTIVTNSRTPIACCSCGEEKVRLRCITLEIWKFKKTVGWFCNECCVKSNIEKLFERVYALVRKKIIKRTPKGAVRKAFEMARERRKYAISNIK